MKNFKLILDDKKGKIKVSLLYGGNLLMDSWLTNHFLRKKKTKQNKNRKKNIAVCSKLPKETVRRTNIALHQKGLVTWIFDSR